MNANSPTKFAEQVQWCVDRGYIDDTMTAYLERLQRIESAAREATAQAFAKDVDASGLWKALASLREALESK